MKLRATATPMATPTPVELPMPTATEAATTVAVIAPVMPATTLMLPVVVRELLPTNAFVLVRIRFVDSAPAPLTATPAPPNAPPTAIDAAAETALIEAVSVALSAMFPDIDSVTPVIEAWTTLSTVLCASATPIETATAFDPATETATDAAPATASIVDVSLALSEMLPGLSPPLPAPLIDALTSVEILFSVHTPEPAKLNAFLPVAATATEAAMTTAWICCAAIAVAESVPPALIVELSTNARICDVFGPFPSVTTWPNSS